MNYTDSKPIPFSNQDWDAIALIEEVREAFSLGETEPGKELTLLAEGAKFDFVSESMIPDERGYVFVLFGGLYHPTFILFQHLYKGTIEILQRTPSAMDREQLATSPNSL